MNLLIHHLEKVVLGVVVVLCALLAARNLGPGAAAGPAAADVSADAGRLRAACAVATGPAVAPPSAGLAATPVLALLDAEPAAATGRGWTFARRPTVRERKVEKPDTRKVLGAPVNLAGTAQDFVVTLRWDDAPETTATTTGYHVWRLAPGGARPPAPTARVAAGTREWQDTDRAALVPDSMVTYTVTATTDAEARHGGAESPAAAPVGVVLPSDRELVYAGAFFRAGDIVRAQVKVRRFHEGKWLEAEFDVKSGEKVGGVKRVDTDADGAPDADVDFTTKYVLKDAQRVNELRNVDGRMVAVDEKWIVVAAPDGAEAKIMAQARTEKPPEARVARDPVTPLLYDLRVALDAARKAGRRDEAAQLEARRAWLEALKPRLWSDQLRKVRQEKLEEERIVLTEDRDTAKAAKEEAKLADLEARLALLQKIQDWKR